MMKQHSLIQWFSSLALALCALALPQAAFAVDAPPSPGDTFAGWATAAVGQNFRSMDFSSAGDGWAIGHRSYNDRTQIQSNLYHFDGERWRWTQTFNDLDLWDVSAVAPDDAWLLGNTRNANGNDISRLFHYDGAAWQAVPAPADVSYGIEMISAQEGYISGAKSLWRYDGNGWTAIAASPRNAALTGEDNQFQALDGQNLWVIDMPTNIGGPPPLGTLSPSIYRFDGAAWQPSMAGARVNSLSIVSPTLGWAGGYQGAMWRYDGAAWQPFTPVPNPYAVNSSYSVNGVAGLAEKPQEAWAVIPAGLYHYDGAAWRALPQSLLTTSLLVMLAPNNGWMGPATRFNGVEWQSSLNLVEPVDFPTVGDAEPGVFLLDRNHAWYGSYVYDAGGWRTAPFTITDALLAQFVQDPAAYVSRTPQLAKIEMFDRNSGWAIGDIALETATFTDADLTGLLFRYDGNGWTALSTPRSAFAPSGSPLLQLRDLAVTGRDTVWVLGDDSAIHRYAGGQWQTVHPARVVNSDEPWFESLAMLSAEEGWAAGSAFLHYTGGQWQVTQPLSNTVYALDMVSAQDGWAVGSDGAIYRYDGASWQEVPSPTTALLVDVAAPAAGVAWAVGYSMDFQSGQFTALLLRYQDSQWQTAALLPQMRLWSISMPDAQNGLIAGSEQLLLRLRAAVVEPGVEPEVWRFFLPVVVKG